MVLSGIHTHSGPGGYLEYVLYDITSLGFVRQSFDALVDGILLVGAPQCRWTCPQRSSIMCWHVASCAEEASRQLLRRLTPPAAGHTPGA